MSVIMAFAPLDEEGIYVGGDRRMMHGDTIITDSFDKWRTIEGVQGAHSPIVVGLAGDPNFFPALIDTAAAFKSNLMEWIQAASRHAKSLGVVPMKDCEGRMPMFDVDVLVVYEGKLYEVDLASGSVLEIPPGTVISYGSGAHYALGGWHALQHHQRRSTEARQYMDDMYSCIVAATRLDPRCANPFVRHILGPAAPPQPS